MISLPAARFRVATVAAACLFLTPFALPAQRAELPEGAADHPMVSPYQGSEMLAYEQSDYDRLELPAATEDGEFETKAMEGEMTRILYAAPRGLSALQVHRNYQMALRDAGFEIVEECLGGIDACRPYFQEGFDALQDQNEIFIGEDHAYFLARHSGADGDVYVTVHTTRHTYHDEIQGRPVSGLQIVEEKPMATGKVEATLTSDAMAEDLEEAGTVRIYGIHFDTDEATVRPQSESTLAEIAALLERNPDLSLAVVGHTDTQGGFEHNMELSLRRAEAVVERLTSDHRVSAERLEAHGVGWLAPVTTNDTEEGRAQNRRVELVKIP